MGCVPKHMVSFLHLDLKLTYLMVTLLRVSLLHITHDLHVRYTYCFCVCLCVCVCLFVSFLCYRIVIQDDHWNPKSWLCRRTGSCGRSLRRRSLPSGPVMIMGGEPARV
jgi:hypothetical protein